MKKYSLLILCIMGAQTRCSENEQSWSSLISSIVRYASKPYGDKEGLQVIKGKEKKTKELTQIIDALSIQLAEASACMNNIGHSLTENRLHYESDTQAIDAAYGQQSVQGQAKKYNLLETYLTKRYKLTQQSNQAVQKYTRLLKEYKDACAHLVHQKVNQSIS